MSFLWTVFTILRSITWSRLHFRRLTVRKATSSTVENGVCAYASSWRENRRISQIDRNGHNGRIEFKILGFRGRNET